MHFQLGALDINNHYFSLPFNASKQNNYKCIECNEKVKFCKGEINKPYFSHYPKSKCTYYEHPSESDIHKNAKYLLANLLESGIEIYFHRTPNCGFGKHEYKLINNIKYGKYDEVKIEYKNDNYIADVALLNGSKIKYIFEIFVTHKTEKERPEPWYEIDGKKLIDYCNNNVSPLRIECIRTNITKLCYGPFCLEEECINKIPIYKTNDKCLICGKLIIKSIKIKDKERKFCFNCYEKDIKYKKIRNFIYAIPNKVKIICFKCKEEGHILPKCPYTPKFSANEINYEDYDIY
jgi:hypothetical protein